MARNIMEIVDNLESIAKEQHDLIIAIRETLDIWLEESERNIKELERELAQERRR